MNKKQKTYVNEEVRLELEKEKTRIKGAWKDAFKLVMKKGNIWALAVGVLIGSTFGAVVNSLANDIIMAAIAKAVGVQGVASLTSNGIAYGKLLSALLTFIIVAFFLIATTAIILYVWRRIVRKKEVAQVATPIVPKTDELILQELKQMNENIKLKNKK